MANFTFQGSTYKYFTHTYNDTRHNERAVEIALALDLIEKNKNGSILEVGDVLPNYTDFKHLIVDKYDSGDNTIHMDIVNYNPPEKFDLIISISTIEHVGWDSGEERWSGKSLKALKHLQNLLKPGGLMMFTFPLGYNEEIDKLLKDKKIDFAELYCLKRDDYNGWDETPLDEALKADYRREACRVGCVGDAAIIQQYSTYLIVGFIRYPREPKNYSAIFVAQMEATN